MPEPKRARAEAALDDVSDHLGVVLQRADELLAQWSAFGATVRGQVEREAAAIGEAVAGAVDAAVTRATAGGIDRAIADQLGARLTALTAEIAKLEARTRAAARAVADERTGDRRLLWAVIGGIVLANALLVALLVRRPAAVPVPAEPAKVELTAPPAAAPTPASEPTATAGSADDPQAGGGGAGELPPPSKENATRPEPQSMVPPTRPVGAPAAAGAVGAMAPGGEQAGSTASPAASAGTGAAGVRATPAAKLPPRVPPQPKK